MSLNTGHELKTRIFEALPVTHQAYFKLLGLLDIQLSLDIPTAEVSLGAESVLKINPDFVDRYCPTDESLTMLVLHEMMHILLGHTRLYRRATTAQNIAFDAVINANLSRLFPAPAYTALFRSLYAEDVLPEALLRPPRGWSTGHPTWALEGEAGELHRALYLDQGVTTGELLEVVERFLAGSGVGAGEPGDDGGENAVGAGHGGSGAGRGDTEEEETGRQPLLERLLGSHRHDDGDEQPAPDLLKEIRDIVARWPRETIRSGRDEGGSLEEKVIARKAARASAVLVIRRALLSVATAGDAVSLHRRMTMGGRPSLQPWRSPRDRRGAVLEAAGRRPLLWSAPVQDRVMAPVSRASLYLDVSGSMNFDLPLIYGALAPLTAWIQPTVYLFSTEVEKIPISALRRGVVMSTGGTGISCVTEHMIANRVRRALIVTDGWVGVVPATHQRQLRNLRAAVVLTAGGDPSFAKGLHARVFHLPQLT